MQGQPALPMLDNQIGPMLRDAGIDVPINARSQLGSSVYAEVAALGEVEHNRLRRMMAVSPEAYLDEMGAFQRWSDIAHDLRADPVIVRAHVMTQLYVAFVWLRDSLLGPAADAVPSHSVTRCVIEFFRTGERRRLRNAVAHGRWRYMADFAGLDCWDGTPPTHFEVSAEQLDAWQAISRGATIAVLLALVGDGGALPG